MACAPPPPQRQSPSVVADEARSDTTSAEVSSAAPSALSPLGGEPFVELAVEGHEPAVVSLPLGATAPRPLLVATHGAGGRAIVHCQLWRRIVGDRGFVLCPRGRSMYPGIPERREDAFYYVGHPQLGREMEVAVAALAERYGAYLDREAPIFAGYSQGASMGALVLPDHPVRFARAVLVEGGVGMYREWDVPTAVRFRRGGGERVVMVCGRVACRDPAHDSARYFERAGISTKVIFVPGAGHSYDDDMQRRVGESFAWLTDGDARWRALSSRSPAGSPSASGSARRSRTTTR